MSSIVQKKERKREREEKKRVNRRICLHIKIIRLKVWQRGFPTFSCDSCVPYTTLSSPWFQCARCKVVSITVINVFSIVYMNTIHNTFAVDICIFSGMRMADVDTEMAQY